MSADEKSTGGVPELPGLELVRRIDGGTFGDVWLAKEGDGTWRAVKLVRRDRFKDERHYEREWHGHTRFEELSRGHVGVVEVMRLERDEKRGFFFSIMELADDVGEDAMDGELEAESYRPRTLQSELAAHGALPAEDCLKIGVSLSRALAHLHGHELVHRDVKPGNVVYVNGKPKLADIGLVAHIDSTPSAVGTYGYIPYEGPGKATADVFALGKVLYEMATGKDRYDYPELPAPNPELRGLNAVILKACADVPADRYADGAEMAEDLERIRDGREPLAARAGAPPWAWVAGLAMVGVAWWLWRGESAEPVKPEVPRWLEGMVAHWPMNGNGREAMGAVKDGNAVGITPAVDRFGKAGGAVEFDGKAYIDFGDQLDMGLSDFTVSAWVKLRETRFSLLVKYGFANQNACWGIHSLYVSPNRRDMVHAYVQDDSWPDSPAVFMDPVQSGLDDERWHQVVAVFERAESLRLYQDGVLLAEQTLKGRKVADLDSQASLMMGAELHEKGNGSLTHFLHGAMDEVRVWKRALSSSEVAEMFRAEAPRDLPGGEAWEFAHRFSHVLEANATRFLVKTNNVKRFIEWQKPPMAYWGPMTNGVEGEMVYRFPFAKAVRQAHLRCTTFTWDFTNTKLGLGRGASAIQVSTNGTDWVDLFNGLEPIRLWEADGYVNRALPDSLMGGTNYLVRIRLYQEAAKDSEYAAAQHARMHTTPGNIAFEFKARLEE